MQIYRRFLRPRSCIVFSILTKLPSQEGRLKSDGSEVLQNENESVVSEAHEAPGLYE